MTCRGCGLPLEMQEEGPLCRSCENMDRASNAFLGRSAFAEMQRRTTRPMQVAGYVDRRDRPDGPSALIESVPCAICGDPHVIGRNNICQNCLRDLEWFDQALAAAGQQLQREALTRLRERGLVPDFPLRSLRSVVEIVRERIAAVIGAGSPSRPEEPRPPQLSDFYDYFATGRHQVISRAGADASQTPASSEALELITAFLNGPFEPIQVGPDGEVM